MSHTAGDIIGLVGSALFVAAFAYANMASALNKIAFNLANLIGAVLLLISLSISFNLASFVLETVWGIIAFIGLISALLKRAKTPS